MKVGIGRAATELGVSRDTLRRSEASGKIAVERTPSGHRRYDLAQLRSLAPIQAQSNRITVAYARISSQGQKEDLTAFATFSRITAFKVARLPQNVQLWRADRNLSGVSTCKLSRALTSTACRCLRKSYTTFFPRCGNHLYEQNNLIHDCAWICIGNQLNYH